MDGKARSVSKTTRAPLQATLTLVTNLRWLKDEERFSVTQSDQDRPGTQTETGSLLAATALILYELIDKRKGRFLQCKIRNVTCRKLDGNVQKLHVETKINLKLNSEASTVSHVSYRSGHPRPPNIQNGIQRHVTSAGKNVNHVQFSLKTKNKLNDLVVMGSALLN